MTSTGSAEIVQCPLVVGCGDESDLNLEKISQMMDCILKEFMRCVYVEAFKGYVLMKKTCNSHCCGNYMFLENYEKNYCSVICHLSGCFTCKTNGTTT